MLIFVQSKERAKELYAELLADNIRVDVIHADLPQAHVTSFKYPFHLLMEIQWYLLICASVLEVVGLNYFLSFSVLIQRDNAVDNFRAGKTWVLIATDVIARGMDFKGVNCVINYDFPDSTAAYIHRIGTLLRLKLFVPYKI